MKRLDRILAAIAREHLLIPTLKTRRSDSLDFSNCACQADCASGSEDHASLRGR
jgi:hypothetical protein